MIYKIFLAVIIALFVGLPAYGQDQVLKDYKEVIGKEEAIWVIAIGEDW